MWKEGKRKHKTIRRGKFQRDDKLLFDLHGNVIDDIHWVWWHYWHRWLRLIPVQRSEAIRWTLSQHSWLSMIRDIVSGRSNRTRSFRLGVIKPYDYRLSTCDEPKPDEKRKLSHFTSNVGHFAKMRFAWYRWNTQLIAWIVKCTRETILVRKMSGWMKWISISGGSIEFKQTSVKLVMRMAGGMAVIDANGTLVGRYGILAACQPPLIEPMNEKITNRVFSAIFKRHTQTESGRETERGRARGRYRQTERSMRLAFGIR